MGEIRFVSQLSANGVFEWQFSGNYWSANGAVFVDKTNKSVTPVTRAFALIRCVSDTWYWGDEQIPTPGRPGSTNINEYNEFRWADAKR